MGGILSLPKILPSTPSPQTSGSTQQTEESKLQKSLRYLFGCPSTVENDSTSQVHEVIGQDVHCSPSATEDVLDSHIHEATSQDFRCSSSATEEGLASQVHEAIIQKNMDLLRNLVSDLKAPMEERNKHGMTPLYHAVFCNWPEGALFLLEAGGNTQNAEVVQKHPGCSLKPLIHLAVRTGSEKLLKKLIKKGASIRGRDCEGDNCAEHFQIRSRSLLFKCMAEAVTEYGNNRSDLGKDLLFILRMALTCEVGLLVVHEFIREQQSSHQRMMLELVAAFFCIHPDHDFISAFEYWRMSSECMTHQSRDIETKEEVGPRSVFADILQLRELPQVDEKTTGYEASVFGIWALYVVEKYTPEDNFLAWAVVNLVDMLCEEGKVVTAIGVIQRLTTIRPLYRQEVAKVIESLIHALQVLKDTAKIPSAALWDSMKIIENCLFLTTSGTSATQTSSFLQSDYEDTLRSLFRAFLHFMIIYCDHQAFAISHEEQQKILTHVKDFVRNFPWTHAQMSFHHLGPKNSDYPSSVSVIKSLVAYSAETLGRVRHVNSPPHLLTDSEGDTPLLSLAKFRSRTTLVEDGVLQCFLDHGADLCTKNRKGETVRSILVKRGIFTEGQLLPSLQCLAATAFMKDPHLSQNVDSCGSTAVRNFLLDHEQ